MDRDDLLNTSLEAQDSPSKSNKNKPAKPAVVKASRRKLLVKMTPELLVSGNGLLALGQSAAKLKFKDGSGSEGSNLHAIMEMYEQWAQNLCPSVSFEEFLIKAERFGRSHTIRSVVDPLLLAQEQEIRTKLGLSAESESEEEDEEAPLPQAMNQPAIAADGTVEEAPATSQLI